MGSHHHNTDWAGWDNELITDAMENNILFICNMDVVFHKLRKCYTHHCSLCTGCVT